MFLLCLMMVTVNAQEMRNCGQEDLGKVAAVQQDVIVCLSAAGAIAARIPGGAVDEAAIAPLCAEPSCQNFIAAVPQDEVPACVIPIPSIENPSETQNVPVAAIMNLYRSACAKVAAGVTPGGATNGAANAATGETGTGVNGNGTATNGTDVNSTSAAMQPVNMQSTSVLLAVWTFSVMALMSV